MHSKSSLEVGNKITLVTFEFHFVMNGLYMLFKVDFLREFLLASFTLKLYAFMSSLLMESKMTQSGVRFSTNITGMFHLHMWRFNNHIVHTVIWNLQAGG